MISVFEAVSKGLALGLLLTLSVGPVIFAVIKHSISGGREGGFSFILGVWLSDFIMITLANLFSELLNRLLDFKSVIGIAGSGLLIIIGIYYLLFKKVTDHPKELALRKLKNGHHARIGMQGFLLNTLNPAVMIFWLTVATTLAISHTIEDRIIIFGTAMAFNMGMDILKITLAGKLRKKLTLKNIRLVNKVSGAIFLIFGVVLLIGVLFFINKIA